jgi:Protoglobin
LAVYDLTATSLQGLAQGGTGHTVDTTADEGGSVTLSSADAGNLPTRQETPPMQLTPPPDNAIPGYTYGTDQVPRSPVTLEDLDKLKQAVGLTEQDQRYLLLAGQVLVDQAADMVTAWRATLGEHPHLAAYSAHPDGRPNPEYSAASKPRFDRWVIDACTRPLDQAWLDYQHEIGLRHTREKKNTTDHADAAEHIPMRYWVAFTAVVLVTARDYLSRKGHSEQDVAGMHAAFTKSVMLHLSVWTRAYVGTENW